MIIKEHKTEDERKILAICDSDLVCKRFEEGNRQIDLNSGFYNGEEKSEKEAANMIKGAYLVNIVGEKSIKMAIDMGIVDKKNIIKIKGIPHAQAIIG